MFSIIEDVKPLHEIEAMPYDKARSYFIDVRSRYSTAHLIAHWTMTKLPNENMYGSKVYKAFEKFGVPVLTDRTRKAHEAKSAKAAQKEILKTFDERRQAAPIAFKCKAIETPPKKKSDKTSFTISLEGEWDGRQIAERIKSIANLLKHDTQYNIIIELQETGE